MKINGWNFALKLIATMAVLGLGSACSSSQEDQEDFEVEQQEQDDEYAEQEQQEQGDEYAEQEQQEQGDDYAEQEQQEQGDEYYAEGDDLDESEAEAILAEGDEETTDTVSESMGDEEVVDAAPDSMEYQAAPPAEVAEELPAQAPADLGQIPADAPAPAIDPAPAPTLIGPSSRVVRFVAVGGAQAYSAPDGASPVMGFEKGQVLMVLDEGEWTKVSDQMFMRSADLSPTPVAREQKTKLWR